MEVVFHACAELVGRFVFDGADEVARKRLSKRLYMGCLLVLFVLPVAAGLCFIAYDFLWGDG
ncbi:hypothetical protein [Sphingosinicella microcystinivorans]|uniref:Uncharacterized protein n=1 Tax=Sphingosinicella microcystinivorans TaxID=335406 RepID=A0AAD1D7T4_SPHMI|nr:hypothetical protein [Sphingosinicella microcystinivorans]RKS91898.1 hypothetical protein DFR51_1472 [Sphingosinicella microcystinivorans]BBE34884.1 hypothetical protein SmB9_25420 [Sphingosinicella microcystinivorans]